VTEAFTPAMVLMVVDAAQKTRFRVRHFDAVFELTDEG
jgi:hypothetical protein